MFKLVSEAKGIGVKEAAAELAKACGVEKKPAPAPEKKGVRRRQIRGRARPRAQGARTTWNISRNTLRTWKAGYSATGVNRGRLALPIESLQHGISVTWEWRSIPTNRPDLSQRDRPAPLYLRRRPRDRKGAVSDTNSTRCAAKRGTAALKTLFRSSLRLSQAPSFSIYQPYGSAGKSNRSC